jgi:polar amino acid transport system substrate-binding protein
MFQRSLILYGALAAAAGLLAACGGTDSGRVVPPPPTTARAPTTTTSAGPPPPCNAGTGDQTDASASLRPSGPLPPPGAMPPGSFMRTIQDRGKLVAGGSPDTRYFGRIDPANGQFSGFDIDLLQEIARAIFGDDGHLEVQTVPVASVVPQLQRGKVDIVAHTLTQTCARRRFIDFSTEYYQASQKVLVRSDSPVRGIDDLRGKRVCAAAGSTSILLLKKQYPVIPVADAENADCLVDLQTGRVDAVSTDDTILAGMVAQDPFAKIVGAPLSSEPYGLALGQQHPEFVRFVNGVLERMRGDGTLQALFNRWLPWTLTPVPSFPTLYRD